jgi:hypothetical protein
VGDVHDRTWLAGHRALDERLTLDPEYAVERLAVGIYYSGVGRLKKSDSRVRRLS